MAISIVLPSSAVAIGELNEFDPANFARRLKYVFDRAGVAWVVGVPGLQPQSARKPPALNRIGACTCTGSLSPTTNKLSVVAW